MKITYALAAAMLLCFALAGPARAADGTLAPEDSFDFSVVMKQSHPRLLLDAREFKSLSREISKGRNPDLQPLHKFLMDEADSELKGKPLAYAKDKSKRRIRCGNYSRIVALAYAYRSTRHKPYLQKAEEDMLALCSFPDWVPTHYLGTAGISEVLALAYDWMYDDLKPRTRAAVEEAVRTKGFDAISEGRNGWWYKCNHNWNQVCNAGVTTAAIVFFEKDPARCSELIRKSISTNRPATMYIYSPDGASPEGPGYWGFGTGNQLFLNMVLEHAYGTDFGLSDTKGFSNSGKYILYVTGNLGRSFNYSDNNSKVGAMPDLWYFARRFNQPDILYFERPRINGKSSYSSTVKNLVALINAWKMGRQPGDAPTRMCFEAQGATPIFTARTGWDKKDLFLGVKGGKASTNHAHMDAGSFVFDAYSMRWAMDYDHPSYSSLEYYLNPMGESLFNMKQTALRWRILIFNNRCHNTLTVNDRDHLVSGFAPMTATFTDQGRMGASFDLAAVFGGDLACAERTACIVDSKYLEVNDVLKAPADAPAHVRWTMLTPAEPEVTPDGIILRQGGVAMLLHAEGADLTYTTWSTDPASYESPTAFFETKVPGTWLVGFETDIPAGAGCNIVTTLKRTK